MDAGTLVYSANPLGLQTIENETMAALVTSLEPLAALGHRSQNEISQEPLEPRSEAIATRKFETKDTDARANEFPAQPKSQADQMVSDESRTLPLPTPELRLSKDNRNVSKRKRKRMSHNHKKGTERDWANNNSINRRAFIKSQ
ncbi:hypothetical protein CPC16_001462 [Podila verticillata]|nr:hypothetical protein CPC16_001462 [Podila verticillata]